MLYKNKACTTAATLYEKKIVEITTPTMHFSDNGKMICKPSYFNTKTGCLKPLGNGLEIS